MISDEAIVNGRYRAHISAIRTSALDMMLNATNDFSLGLN